MGYGDRGAGRDIPGGATLNFDVEVVDIYWKASPTATTSASQVDAEMIGDVSAGSNEAKDEIIEPSNEMNDESYESPVSVDSSKTNTSAEANTTEPSDADSEPSTANAGSDSSENQSSNSTSREKNERERYHYAGSHNRDDIDDADRPVMHTFFQEVKQGELHLLRVWEKEWRRVGFRTKVLTMEDAKNHSLYNEMKEVIDPLWKELYNGLCFYRWIAMASVGGGWMSDYDCFPTNFPIDEGKDLPYDGNFTSYELHVPSLLSGSQQEWERVSKLILEAVPRIENNIKSDMYAFLQLREEDVHHINFISPTNKGVLNGFFYTEPRKVNCGTIKNSRAIHLSHYSTQYAVDKGLFPAMARGKNPIHRRGEAAKTFLSDWRHQCGGSHMEIQRQRRLGEQTDDGHYNETTVSHLTIDSVEYDDNEDTQSVVNNEANLEKVQETSQNDEHHHSSAHDRSDDDDTDKPMMHTFFDEVKEGELHLLRVWEKEWRRAGFRTKVLTMENARNSSLYEEMKEVIDPIWKESTYNGLCFYRWIAMVEAGGGWMSDYDLFPTNFPIDEGKALPYDGNFTGFEMHVPSLLSGSQQEWERVSRLLLEAVPNIGSDHIKSDMHAFKELREDGIDHNINFLYKGEVLNGFFYTEPRKVDCEIIKISRAIHFSHYGTHEAIEKGVFPAMARGKNPMHRRGEAAKTFLSDWRNQCGGQHMEVE